MLHFSKLAGAIALAFAAAPGFAFGIVDIDLDNLSSLNEQINDAGERLREFRSLGVAPANAAASGGVADFTSRMSFMSAQRVEPGGTAANLIWNRSMEYSLTFTVDDPTNQGYRLSVDTRLRGQLAAKWGALQGDNNVDGVFAFGVPLLARFDDGTGPTLLPGLTNLLQTAVANKANPEDRVTVDQQRDARLGEYHGTREFTLRFALPGEVPNVGADLLPFNIGEANVRFGLNPLLGGFGNAEYGDAALAATHGHFVRITAEYLQPVPEPQTWALMGLGLAAMGWQGARRRRQADGSRP